MLSQRGPSEVYDLVLQGGRVIDPETGLDGVRNVGIRGDRIMEISDRPLRGREVLDVSGLVVAPGFIDLHAHGQTNEANEYQAHDGVTTALELESGEDFLTEWLASRTGRALINFGATVPHAGVRWRAMDQYAEQADRMGRIVRESGLDAEELAEVRRELGQARYEPVPPGRLAAMVEGLEAGLRAGALGIGVSVGYYPGATRGELFEVYRVAAEWQAPVFTHVREVSLAGIQEAIALAAVTGAPLHIVHLCTSCTSTAWHSVRSPWRSRWSRRHKRRGSTSPPRSTRIRQRRQGLPRRCSIRDGRIAWGSHIGICSGRTRGSG